MPAKPCNVCYALKGFFDVVPWCWGTILRSLKFLGCLFGEQLAPGPGQEPTSFNAWPEEERHDHHRGGSKNNSRGPCDLNGKKTKNSCMAKMQFWGHCSVGRRLWESTTDWFWFNPFLVAASSRRCCSAEKRLWKLSWMATSWAVELWS